MWVYPRVCERERERERESERVRAPGGGQPSQPTLAALSERDEESAREKREANISSCQGFQWRHAVPNVNECPIPTPAWPRHALVLISSYFCAHCIDVAQH